MKDLVQRLRDEAPKVGEPENVWCSVHAKDLREAADLIESQAAQIAALKTVMIAAAEEIAAHWEAHCDAEGYGPQNLLRRLEEGIPSEYGYTAGAFAALTAERNAPRAALACMQQVRTAGRTSRDGVNDERTGL